MSTELLKFFIEKPVRETSGSRSSNRFDYQKNWSLCELLELHANNPDYLMIFEHHEDVVVFDSQENPASATFYQVKSKNKGNWTINSLVKRKKESPSILEKLYKSHLEFTENAERLIFTSNQPLSAKLRNGEPSATHGRVTFYQLTDKDKEKICSSLAPEEQNYCDLIGLQKIETERNALQLEDHTTITKGKLVEFFEKQHPEEEINASLVYRTFFDEIRRKTNFEGPISNISDLLKYKSIGRSDFGKMIGAVVKRISDTELWSEASETLTSEGYSFSERRKIYLDWKRYIIAKMDASDDLHLQFTEDVKNRINIAYAESGTNSFKDLSEITRVFLVKKYSSDYGIDYINAATLYEALRNDPISTPNTEFTEEAK